MKALEKDNITLLSLSEIRFDIDNPRGEKEEQIIQDPEFNKLVASINEHGILEPLIVKKDIDNEGFYILIDGERRLRASIKLEKTEPNPPSKKVPVLVAKNDVDGRILAYQVHMLRKPWDSIAETKSIKTIIADIKKDKPNILDKDLSLELKNITAHKPFEISEFLKLIKYDDDVLEKVKDNKIDKSYLIQIESSFINPLKSKYPEIFQKYKENDLRTILINKAESGFLVNTRFLMDKFKDVFNEENNKDFCGNLIEQFLNNKKENIQKTYDEYLKMVNNPKQKPIRIKKQKSEENQKLVNHVENKNSDYKKITLTKKEQSSVQSIRKNFENIGGTLSKEEKEYIAEAIHCFEEKCNKAAIVMIWAAGVSRVINNISKNISQFKNDCNAIDTNKVPYKYYKEPIAKMKSISIEEDLRNGVDMPLIVWLLSQKMISAPEYKKLKADFDKRCDCAHPTNIELSPNEVITVFEDIYKLIFANSNMQ